MPYAEPMTTDPTMSHQRFWVPLNDWTDLHQAVGRKRSAILRDLIRWYLRRPDAPLPERPIRPSPDTCSLACIETHMYEGECLVSPMIIGTISPRVENGITAYSWRCDWDGECGGLRHLGYPSAAAARRAYDRHLKAEHGVSAA